MRGSETKKKGDLAELAVAHDLVKKGYRILFPYGENCPYDMCIEHDSRFMRIQVKYSVSTQSTWVVKPYSMNGYVAHKYTAVDVDYIAAYDGRTETIIYIPSSELGDGKAVITFRFLPTANGQIKGIRFVSDYLKPPA